MTDKQKYYKVVGKDLKSYLNTRCKTTYRDIVLPDGFAIQYIENEWVKGVNLFVFTGLKQAKNFVRIHHYGDLSYSKYKIYECEVKNPKDSIGIIAWKSLGILLAEFFILRKQKKKYTHMLSPAPNNSKVCSAVKLIRRIH